MKTSLKEVCRAAKYDISENEIEEIWHTIVIHEKRVARAELAFFSVLGFISFAGLIPVFKILSINFTQSGFFTYFSLLFSDGGLMAAYWKDFAFLLAESFPVMSIVGLLALVFVFFLSLWYVLKQVNRNKLSLSF